MVTCFYGFQSFAMGSQNVVVRGMKTPMTIPTQVATGAMADLVSDPRLFAAPSKNWPRNERLIFILVFFFGRAWLFAKISGTNNLLIHSGPQGGVIGGLGYRYSSPQLTLLLTAIGKLLAAMGFLLAKPVQDKQPVPAGPPPQPESGK